jgi:hypothetical protein
MRRPGFRALLLGFALLTGAAEVGCGRVGLNPDDGLDPAGTGTGGLLQGTGGAIGTGGAGVGGAPGTGGATTLDCGTLDEITCHKPSSTCRPDYCTDCSDGSRRFVKCSQVGSPAPVCPMPMCMLLPCAQVKTRDDCDRRTDCHSVLMEPSGGCDASAIACAVFVSCAAGDRARCVPPSPICHSIAPRCGPGLAISYTYDCYEGCVNAIDCAESMTPPPR